MCMFSQAVSKVAKTSIFARVVGGAPPRQILVYSMEFSAAEDLAMVLPLPTPAGSPEDAVNFVSLEDYPEFFTDMASGFPSAQSRSRGVASNGPGAAQTIEVHAVGAFEASFVPRRADFSRLDARFRLPDTAWEGLPIPADYGYAVFKLKAGENQSVHPMALSFPTRNHNHIFFPTIHVHGGDALERRAVFDHALYFQGADIMRLPLACDAGTARLGRLAGKVLGVAGGAKPPETTPGKASDFMKTDPERGLVDPDMKVHRFELSERLPNIDAMLWPKYHEKAGQYA